jgi:hypothetical protein
MPKPTNGCVGLKAVFEDNIFSESTMPWTLTAAISGAHTLGGANTSASGFKGSWSDSKNQGRFNNNYYKSLLTKGWVPEVNVGGVEGVNQWARADDGQDPAHKEMMLDTDMCLFYTTNRELSYCKKFSGNCKLCNNLYSNGRSSEEINASNGHCCAWI